MERGYTALMPSDLSHALFTDLYELTMAQAFWRRGMDARASFSLFFRSLPPGRGYLVAAGVEECLDHLASLRFTPEDLTHLHTLGLFDAGFLDTLGGLRFTGEARCVEEGEIVFANEPIIEVSAPIIEAQIVETYLLNRVGFQTLIATKAARTAHAAAGRAVVDFGARRAHGLDAAAALARLAYLTGFDGTSNVRAGVRYGIPVRGTMAHSFVMSFESEAGAFRAYAEAFPDSATLLIDTYDPVEGLSAAIEAARDLRRRGSELRAVRIDSGDLAALSILARRRLDDDGFPGVTVFVSGGLDEIGHLLHGDPRGHGAVHVLAGAQGGGRLRPVEPVLGEESHGVDAGVRAELLEAGAGLGDPVSFGGGGELVGVEVAQHHRLHQGMGLEEGDEVGGEGAAADDADTQGHGRLFLEGGWRGRRAGNAG